MALVPHARTIWVAAGPGNNGGDGMEAAMHLQQWGRDVVVTRLGNPQTAPADAQASHQRALQAGVRFADDPPPQWDLCIDALLGIGATRAPQDAMARWIGDMLRSDAPVLAIDNPTGLDADTGQAASVCVKAIATLSLLTLKPGLFTADGRDMAGQIWFDDLQIHEPAQPGAGPAAMPRTRAVMAMWPSLAVPPAWGVRPCWQPLPACMPAQDASTCVRWTRAWPGPWCRHSRN
jgi:hydroxyethylthiazole kinase-like uncharacterized protein yjeF